MFSLHNNDGINIGSVDVYFYGGNGSGDPGNPDDPGVSVERVVIFTDEQELSYSDGNVTISCEDRGNESGAYVSEFSPMTVSMQNGILEGVEFHIGDGQYYINETMADKGELWPFEAEAMITVGNIKSDTLVLINRAGFNVSFVVVYYIPSGSSGGSGGTGTEHIETNSREFEYNGNNVSITCDNPGDDRGAYVCWNDQMYVTARNGMILDKVVFHASRVEMENIRYTAAEPNYRAEISEEDATITVSNIQSDTVVLNNVEGIYIESVDVSFASGSSGGSTAAGKEHIATNSRNSEYNGNKVHIRFDDFWDDRGGYVSNHAGMNVVIQNNMAFDRIVLHVADGEENARNTSVEPTGRIYVSESGRDIVVTEMDSRDVWINNRDGIYISSVDVFYSVSGGSAPTVYTLTWRNWDGAELDWGYLEEGDYPEYRGNAPTRPTDALNTYSFSGWTPEITYASGDITYVATFNQTPREYTVTYKVVGGTWSDGRANDRTETVFGGAKPASVPTGMKASNGYTGGAWNANPAETAIMGNTTFTYTFVAKTASTVNVAPTAKQLFCNGSAQALVTAGTAEGGQMQYALGADATHAPTSGWSANIPTATEAGTYYVSYRVAEDESHLGTEPAGPIEVTMLPGFGTPDFTLPAFLTRVEAEAFEGISASVVDVPASCTAIGDRAFRNCPNLTQIRIPAGCTLGADVFDGCALVHVYGTAGSAAEAYCNDPAHGNCVFVADTQN